MNEEPDEYELGCERPQERSQNRRRSDSCEQPSRMSGGPIFAQSGRLARFLHFLDSTRRRSALATGDESTEEIQEHEYSPKCRTADTASTLSSNHGRELAAREIP